MIITPTCMIIEPFGWTKVVGIMVMVNPPTTGMVMVDMPLAIYERSTEINRCAPFLGRGLGIGSETNDRSSKLLVGFHEASVLAS